MQQSPKNDFSKRTGSALIGSNKNEVGKQAWNP
jgi:hypothetical protein